ncbi:hypothetical protein [Mycolicibacterium sp. XJ870]
MHHPDHSSLGDTPAVSRRDRFLLASVAVVGAGAIAVTPVAPTTSNIQQVQTHAYDLTASMDATASPIEVYGSLFKDTFSNLQHLGEALAANPAPLLSQVVENQLGYAGQFGAAFQAIPTSLQSWYEGPNGQARLAQAQAALEAGDIDEAYRWFNHSMLYAFQGAFGPLIAPGFILSGIPRGGTEYMTGIPEQIAQNFTNLIATSFTSTVLVSAVFQGVFSSISGPVFELSRIGESLNASMASGDVEGAFNALVNTPGILVNAALNGFDYSDPDPETGTGGFTEWPALLTWAEEGEQGGARIVAGLLQNLLVNIPKSLADAIDNTPEVEPTTPPAVEAAKEVSADLGVLPPAAVTEPTVETVEDEALSVEAPKDEATSTTTVSVVTDEVTAETTKAPATGAAVNEDGAVTGKAKIQDRIKAKINEAKEARAAKAKAAKDAREARQAKAKEAKDTKDTKDTKSGESNGNSGSESS